MTHTAVDRLWIPFELGVSVGRNASDAMATCIAVGLHKSVAFEGPFGQIQGCGWDADDIAGLLRDILQSIEGFEQPADTLTSEVKKFMATAENELEKKKSAAKDGAKDVATPPTSRELMEAIFGLRSEIRSIRTSGTASSRRDAVEEAVREEAEKAEELALLNAQLRRVAAHLEETSLSDSRDPVATITGMPVNRAMAVLKALYIDAKHAQNVALLRALDRWFPVTHRSRVDAYGTVYEAPLPPDLPLELDGA